MNTIRFIASFTVSILLLSSSSIFTSARPGGPGEPPQFQAPVVPVVIIPPHFHMPQPPQQLPRHSVHDLIKAINKDDTETASRYIREGIININEIDHNSNATALFMAVLKGNIKIVNDLINAGADVNRGSAVPPFPRPLGLAQRLGNLEIIDILRRAGAH